MSWDQNTLAGSKRALEKQLTQSFSSSNKKHCFWPCPVCHRSFASFILDDHIDHCVQSSHSSQPTVKSSDEPAGSFSSRTGPICIDVFSVLQDVADQNLPASEIIPAKDTANFQGALTSHDLQCESGKHSCNDPSRCKAAIPRNCDVRDDPVCTQVDTSLCTNGLCGSEISADDGRALSYSSEIEVGLRNLGESERPEPDMGKLGCQEIMGSPVETDIAKLTGGREAGNFKKQELGGLLQDGNGPVVERPPAGFKLYQRQKQSQAKLSMFFKLPLSAATERRPTVTVLLPGMILFKNWLDLEKQQQLVEESQKVAHLFHRPVTSGGGKYHVYSVCWGPKWDPKSHLYAGRGAEIPLPDWMFDLAQEITREAQQHSFLYPPDPHFAPDVALANFYPVKSEELGHVGLGGHQDLDDSCTMPVVSVSVGDSMTFFYRRLPPLSRRKSMIYVSVDEKAAKNCQDGDAGHNREQQIVLRSGDVLVFGGESRLIYHGTRHVQAGTRPPGLHMVPGRLNFTFRQTDASLSAQKSCSVVRDSSS